MKVFISADIEGITGSTHVNEIEKSKTEYNEFSEQMTAEVAAACEGALNAGATEIWVKDAHDTGRNIMASKLPREARLVRGWSGHPMGMVQELDNSFSAVLFIGYHSRAGAETNPLAHTLTGRLISVKINDRYASEFLMFAYAAGLVEVPVAFVSGDEGLCMEVESLNPSIDTLAVKTGIGNSTISIHPGKAVNLIRDRVEKALKNDLSRLNITLPDKFTIVVRYRNHADAYKTSFFPGACLLEPCRISFETNDYFEVLRLLLFAI